MTNENYLAELRTLIREEPNIVLDDPELMRDLAQQAKGSLGDNVIDLRGAALKVLEQRRIGLEVANRAITEDSQRNFASLQRVHRAIVSLLNCQSIDEWCTTIRDTVKDILQIDCLLVFVESPFPNLKPNEQFGPIKFCHKGFVCDYCGGQSVYQSGRLILRSCPNISSDIYPGFQKSPILSEALLPLSLRLARHANGQQDISHGDDFALMLLGSGDSEMFQPQLGSELLTFFRDVVECSLRRWSVSHTTEL